MIKSRTAEHRTYDAFVSYSSRNREWVREWLVPRLRAAGLEVCVDYDSFLPGRPTITEMERAVLQSRKTVLVLSPEYFESEWGEFENILSQTLDPAAKKGQVIPLLFSTVEAPPRIRMLTYIDFTDRARYEVALPRLLEALRKNRMGRSSRVRVRLHANVHEFGYPDGALGSDSTSYVERDSDRQIREEILKQGSTILVVGSRQMGKSSSLARAFNHAETNECRVVHIDFQGLDDATLLSLDGLLLCLAQIISQRLRVAFPDGEWEGPTGPNVKLTNFLGDQVLGETERPVVLLLDEVDRLFDLPYRNDVFSLIRAWHNLRATGRQWRRLNLVLAYSTDPRASISQIGSPFNVGCRIELQDFSKSQVEELNGRYKTPLSNRRIAQLVEWVGGHPFLIHRAIYAVATGTVRSEDLISMEKVEDGPFADYLHHLTRVLEADREMRQAMTQVIVSHFRPNYALFERLRSRGLIVEDSKLGVRPRCRLYAEYFSKRLS